MKKQVVIVDYGMGNVFSVSRALEFCGAEAVLSADAAVIEAAQYLILPGVGAFPDGMQELSGRGLVEPLRRYARSGKPFLGICLGMQMFFQSTEEFGFHEGLGILPGMVKQIPDRKADGSLRRIPHIGWNRLLYGAAKDGAIATALGDNFWGYFVHSFAAETAKPEHRLAYCDYDGFEVTAVVGSENILGCQFHPEKSGLAGLRLLARFLGEETTANPAFQTELAARK